MKNLIREVWQIIRLNRRNLLIFEVLYRAASMSLYLRLVNMGLRFSLDRAGYSYLTADNALRFFFLPWTVLVLVLLAAIGLILIMIEIGGLVTAYAGAACSLRVKPYDILAGGVRSAFWELKKRNFRLFGTGFLLSLSLNLFYIGRALSHIKPVGFILAESMDHLPSRAALYLVPALSLAVAAASLYLFHECMLDQKSYRDGLRKSLEFLLADRWKTAVCLISVQALVVAGLIVFYLAAVTVTAVIAILFVSRDLELIFLMEVIDRTEMVLLFAAGMGSMVVHFAAVSVLYNRLSSGVPAAVLRNWPGTRDMSLRKKGVAFVCLWGILAAGCLGDAVYHGNYISRSVTVETSVTAHRGASREAPENTVAAIEAAVTEMADQAEIDVQLTKDGYVVVCHDLNLRRLAGLNRKIEDMTLEELKQADVGSWFSREFSGTGIPTLQQVLECAKGRIDLNIELKNIGNNSELPQKVLELVRSYDMMSQCIITSANLRYLERLKELEPELKTGYVLSAAYGRSYENDAIDIISIRSDLVTAKLVEAAHEAGKAVHVWTVNDKMEIERMRALMVDGIITDDPVLVREILYREEATETWYEYLRLLLR